MMKIRVVGRWHGVRRADRVCKECVDKWGVGRHRPFCDEM